MHLLRPDLFMLWDGGIIRHYKAKRSAQGYLDFTAKMQKMYQNGEFKRLKTEGVTIPRAIDLYNMEL